MVTVLCVTVAFIDTSLVCHLGTGFILILSRKLTIKAHFVTECKVFTQVDFYYIDRLGNMIRHIKRIYTNKMFFSFKHFIV